MNAVKLATLRGRMSMAYQLPHLEEDSAQATGTAQRRGKEQATVTVRLYGNERATTTTAQIKSEEHTTTAKAKIKGEERDSDTA